jgi:hypothetical protein
VSLYRSGAFGEDHVMGKDDRYGRAFALADPDVRDALEEEGDGTEALLARLARAQSALVRERSDAPALVAELLEEPSPERRLDRVASDPRFQTWGVCELLLDQGSSTQEAEPAESAHLAELALAAADRLDPVWHAGPVVEDFRARAWACLGGARLRTGDLAGAEGALRHAAACLALGTGDLLVEACLLEFEAAVRERQGRLGEAAALLKQAAVRYREIGDAQHLARAQRSRDEILERVSGGRGSSPSRPGHMP